MLTNGNPIDCTFIRIKKELAIVQKMGSGVSQAFNNLELLCELLGEWDIPSKKREYIIVELEHLKSGKTDFIKPVLNRLIENIKKKRPPVKLVGPYVNNPKSELVHSNNVVKLFR